MAKGISRAWFLIPAALGLLGVWTIVSTRTPTTARPLHEGRRSAVVTLRAPEGGGAAAGPFLIERLVALGVDGTLLEATDQRIRVEVRRVDDPREALAAAVTPAPVSFFLVDEADQRLPGGDPPSDVDAGPLVQLVHPWLTGRSRADLQAKLDAASLPEGLAPLVECVPGPERSGPPLCAAWLGRPAPLRADQVREVSLGADIRTEEPLVTLRFDADGARTLAELAAANAGRMLVVSAFGEVQARPKLEGALTDGSWTFSTRTGDTARPTAIDRAKRIAAAVELPALPPLVVDQVE